MINTFMLECSENFTVNVPVSFQQLEDGSVVTLDSGIHYFYSMLKAPGEHIKHPGKGLRVFIQGTASSLEQKSLTVGSLMLYKVS